MKKMLGLFALLALVASANAQTGVTTATQLVSDAGTVVTAVEAIVAGAVAFFIGVKIVKWIRK